MTQPRPLSAILGRTFIFGLWSLPALVAFYMMWTHWVAVPFWDEWDTPGKQLASYYRGTLTFAELFSQHNEHRSLFPRLIWLPMAIMAGWDVRHAMLLAFCFVCLGSVGLYKLLGSSNRTVTGRVFVFGLMNLVLFSPRLYETFLVGAQGQTFVPTFMLVLALLVNLSGRSLPTKTIANAALALIATFSLGNGMLVWLLAFPLETESGNSQTGGRRKKILWRAVYLVIATLSIASYFISYRHPPITPPVVSPFAQLPGFLRFVLVWIGSLFTTNAPVICGALALFLFIGLTIAALRQMQRTGRWQPHYPWIVLGCYTIISGGIAAMARLGFDYSMAGDSRYTAFSAFFYIALLGLGFSVYTQSAERPFSARIAWPVASASLVIVLTLWIVTFQRERRLLRREVQFRKHTQMVVRWIDAIPQNPDLMFSSPYSPRETVETIRIIAAHGALRPRLVSSTLARAVNAPPGALAATGGTLEQATLDGNDRLIYKGWARIADQDRPADCVVLGFETEDGRWQPFCVLETGEKRPDVAQLSGNPSLVRAGFSRTIDARSLPRSGVNVRAWAIDLEGERVFPMAGEIRVEVPAAP